MEHESDDDMNYNSALGTVTNGLLQGLEEFKIRGWVKIIQTTASECWEESWRLVETCSHSNSSEKPSAYAGVKNSQKSKMIMEEKTKQTNVAMAWINSKRAYDMIPQIFIIECHKIIKLPHEDCEKLKRELTVGEQTQEKGRIPSKQIWKKS